MTVTVEEPTTAAPLVRLTDAGKNYGNILALQGVTLRFAGAGVRAQTVETPIEPMPVPAG